MALGRVGSLIAMLLIALSGCDGGGSGSCKISTAADLKLLPNTEIPSVIGSLDGQQVAVMLDTGAAASTVTPEAVSISPMITRHRDDVVRMTGIGGTTDAELVTVHHLELGSGHARDFDLPVSGGLPDKIHGLPVLGLFGADFMSNYDVDFDLPHGHFGMYDLVGCGNDIQPVSTPYYTVPFSLDGTAIEIEIRLNGVPIQADLDSGSGQTMIAEDDARSAGITDEMLAADRAQKLNGVGDIAAVDGRLHRFAALEIGAERMKNFPLAVASTATAHTLLGAEFFRLNRIWISYPRRMLYIQPALSNSIFHKV